MHIRAGERLRLTLSDAGGRAMVSLNTYAVTQPAIDGSNPSEDGFIYDVTPWLSTGRNVLTVVLIGPPDAQPFRMTLAGDSTPAWTLDESEFLRTTAPWRLWTQQIEMEATTDRPLVSMSPVLVAPLT